MTTETDDENKWIVTKKKYDRKRSNSTTQVANFQKHRPNDSIINDDNHLDDSDDEHQLIDVLENPLFWNKFALIGNITEKVNKILLENNIYPKGQVMKFFNCIRTISRNITRDYLYQDFDNVIENLNQKIIFLSVIPRFTKREYGKGKPIYMIHIRFDFYLMADTSRESYDNNFLFGFNDYDGFLGETCTHIPVSDESEESLKNRNNFNNVMKILKDKRKSDVFQPDYEPECIVLPENKVTHNSQSNSYYKPISLQDISKIKKYKCKLVLGDAHSGYGEILEGKEIGQKIYLHNRRNCSKAFNGDIVEIMKFDSSNDSSKKKNKNKRITKSMEKNQQHTGRVISVLKSDIKPINKIFLCHLIFGTSNLMVPICNTIPVIYVDNKYASEQVKKHSNDLKQIDAIDIENLVKLTVNRELAEKFANQNFVTVKKLDDNLTTSVNKIYHVNCYACDLIFLVLYRKWGDNCRFPSGEVVGIYTPDVKFENTLNLIKVTCDVPVIGIDEEKPLQDEIAKIKILRMREKIEKKISNKIIFCFKSLENREFNDIAYSYQTNDSNEVVIGVHVTNVSKFVQEEGFLDKSAQNRFFSFLIPDIDYDDQNTAQSDYLLSKAISKEFLSINRERATDVISFYFQINDENKIIKDSVLMEKIILNREIYAKTADKLIETEFDDDKFYNRIYNFCYSIRSQRIKYIIPVQCYFPNFQLKTSQSAFIIESELKRLVNEKASIVYERFSPDRFIPFTKWCNDTKSYCNVKWSPLIKLFLRELDRNFNNNNFLDLRLSKQFLDTILNDPKNNLFKCESLFPDIGYCHEQYKSIAGSEIIDFFEYHGSTLLSITSPLSCYLDIFAQRIFESLYQDNSTSDIFKEKIDEYFLKYKDFKVLHDKYWSICKAYEVKDRFNGISFVLDCVFDSFTDEKFTFFHPFLTEVNLENFIVLKCLRLNKIPLKMLDEGVLMVSLNWKTKVFLHGPYEVGKFKKNEIELKDIYSYNEKDFRYEIIYTDLNSEDLHKMKTILDKNPYPDQLTSEIIEDIDPLMTLTYQIKDRQLLRVQFSYDYSSGIMKLVPELLIINPDFRVCLTHSNDPLKYFMHPRELTHINYKRFYKLDEYKRQFIILNRLEGIHQTISGDSHFSIHALEIDWIAKTTYNNNDKSHDIYGIVILDKNWCKSRFIKIIHKKTNIRDPVNALHEAVNKNKMDYLLCIQTFLKDKNVYWVGHGRVCDICLLNEEINSNVTNKKKRKNYKIHLTFKLVHSSFPIKNLQNSKFFIEFMESPISTRIFDRSLRKLQKDTFLENIVLENAVKINKLNNHKVDYELIKSRMVLKCDLNEKQLLALNKSVNYEFTLIWGPPGTGKTLLGCMIAYWYTLMNKEQPRNPLVLYCGPSNQSVDVVAEKMLKTYGTNCPKLLRIFNSEVTNHDFPYGMRRLSESTGCPESLKDIALHFVVRQPGKPYAKNLKDFENKFMANTKRVEMERNEFATELNKYESCLRKAFEEEIKNGNYEIILTTAAGSCKKLLESSVFFQVILDECGMCSEPEAIGPMLNKTELKHLVLIGDHKQLRPIVTSQVAKGKQLDVSLFERLYKPNRVYCTMLDTQYRMHPSICEFPSFYIYGNKPKNKNKSNSLCLKTIRCESWTGIPDKKASSFPNFNGLQYVNLYKGYQQDLKRNNIDIADEFWGKNGIRKSNFKCYNKDIDFSLQSNPVREKILFIHAVGSETDQEISCSTGSNHTKSNELEAEIVRSLYEKLIQKIPDKKTASQSILVITQYRLQESNLNDICKKILIAKGIPGPARVSTVVKSQGSESDYVIFSTVRSLPNVEDIEQNPTSGWISKYLGFITDENQFNVALTRAKKGLFIIGNSYLLSVHPIWKALIDDLKNRECFKENYLDLL